MGRIRQVRESDGTLSPYRERKIAESLHQALKESGTDDRALADELAGVVSLFLERTHKDGAEPPRVSEIQDTVEHVLRETGHEPAARRFRKTRRQREELRDQVTVRSAPRRAADSVDFAGAPFSAVESAQWSRTRLVRSLSETAELPGPVAEEIASAVERKVFALELKSVSADLVRHLVACELFERGLDAPDRAGERVPIPVRSLTEDLFAPEPGRTTPAEAIAGAVLEHFALTEIHGPEVAAAHLEGALHVHGLDRPLAVERVAVSWDLAVRSGRDGAAALLDLRRALDAVRPSVAGTIELPDAAARLLESTPPAEAASAIADLIDAAEGRDAYGRHQGPAVEISVPLDRTPPAAMRRLAERVLAAEAGALRVRFTSPPGRGPDADLAFAAASELLCATPFAALEIGTSEASADAPPPGLRLAIARVTLNLPLLLMNAAGEGVKEALDGLERGARAALLAFQERAFSQRKGPPFGVQAIVAALGGPASIGVAASGHEADVEVWGLAHAIELLVRRGLVARPSAPEAAARILGRILYHLGEERDGIRFRVRMGGCPSRATRRRMLLACEEQARRFGVPDLLAELANERAVEGVLPLAIPLADRRNRLLLSSGIVERLGFGLGIAQACLPGVLSAAALAEVAACSRMRTLMLAPPGAGAPFEVQEELFGDLRQGS